MSDVLITDDSAFMRSTIRRILEKERLMVVAEAESGPSCIEKYKEYRPEIVTLDIIMLGMDGIATLKALMKIDPNAKVIMITALGQESFVREAILSGARSFIVKPFQEEHVISALHKVMAH